MRHHYRIFVSSAALACLFALASIASWPALAECDSDSGCSACCPRCKLEVGTENVKRNFYEVVCKDICIPKVTFPWQKPCSDSCKGGCASGCCECPVPCKGARIRTVKVLKKYQYECERCKYKWTPEYPCSCCRCTENRESSKAAARQANSAKGSIPPIPPETTTRFWDRSKSIGIRK